jgi:hypothetical protein
MRADAFAHSRIGGERTSRSSFRLAHAAERQGAERSETAAGKA